MYFNSMFNMDKWNSDAEYIIFDDFPWDQLRRWYKQFFGAQYEFEITDKYRHKKTVKWGKPCIFLGNLDNNPRLECTNTEWEWINGNVLYYELQDKMFDEVIEIN